LIGFLIDARYFHCHSVTNKLNDKYLFLIIFIINVTDRHTLEWIYLFIVITSKLLRYQRTLFKSKLFYTMKDLRKRQNPYSRDSFAEMLRVARGFSSRLKVAPLLPVIRETSAGDDGTVLSRVSLSRSSFLKTCRDLDRAKTRERDLLSARRYRRHSQMDEVVVRRASSK